MDFKDDDNDTANFHHGESKTAVAANISDDPMEYIARCRRHRTKSVREVVLSAVAAIEGIDAVKDETEKFAQFLRDLADAKVISKAEAAKVDLSKMSTISKLRTIVQHKDIIVHSTVADKMCVSYSVAYELGKLIEVLPSNGDVTSQLASHLEELDGPLTRKWVTDLRQRIAPKPPRKKAAVVPTEKAVSTAADGATNVVHLLQEPKGRKADDGSSASDNARPDFPVAQLSVSRSVVNRSEAVTAEMERPFSGLLIKLVSSDDDANNDGTEEQLSFELSKDSLVLIQANLKTLLERSDEIIASYRMDRFVGIYLTERPIAPDVTANEAIAVYERGNLLAEDRQIVWPSATDAASVVDSLLDGIRSRTVCRVVSHEVADW